VVEDGSTLPTGYFETERSQVEAPPEEVRDFDFLIDEVQSSSRDEARDRMPEWIERFQREWTNGSDQWGMLVELLPRPRDLELTVGQFRNHLLSATREPSAADLFLGHPAVVSKLSSYAWTDFLAPPAVGFVAGCLNLARAAAQSGSPSSAVMGTLSNAVANYALTLIGIGLHDPGIVIPTDDGCSLADALDVPRERFAAWSFEKSEHELQRLVTTFDLDKLLQVLHSLLGQTDIPDAVAAPMVKAVLEAIDDPRAAAFIGSFAFENADLSAALKARYFADGGAGRARLLSLWARYLTLADAFRFGWECVKPPAASESTAPLEESLEERLGRLQELLRIPRTGGAPSVGAEWRWREPALRALAAIGSLAARKWVAREDRLVCEDDAIAALSSCHELLSPVVGGILDHCSESWDVLDPIILRLPTDLSTPVLTDYADRASVWLEARHHAARLLTQIKGEALRVQGGDDLPSEAQNLPEPKRERRPLSAQTWLGDGAVERLWHVALEVAQTRFDECMAARYADDKDEHCAALADVMARALNGTNAALKMWLRWSGAPPPTIRAAARRVESKTKRAGSGLQADLAFLIRCKVAGKCVTERITPMRVKKLAPSANQRGWPGEFRLQGSDRTQLTRLLTISSSTHYLFILPREMGGESVRVLPGPLIRDMLAVQGFGGSIPVSTVLQAGMRLPEFLLFNVLGLWTGDDDKDLVAKAEPDADPGQQPHVVLDVTVSKD
jgi:hypothetical protein